MAPFHKIYIYIYSTQKLETSFLFFYNNNNNILAIKCQFTHDLIWYAVGIFLIAIFHRGCPIRSTIFYQGCSTHFAISTERMWDFFFLGQCAFMCKHLYHHNFLFVSLSLKKKFSLTIFLSFFC